MRISPFLAVFFLISSCIPYSFAPEIEGTKLTKAKRFKSDLPKQEALIFKDEGEEYEFYNFLADKFAIVEDGPLTNVPFELDNKTYYLSYFERERATRTFNLLPVFMDAVLESNEIEPVLEESYTSRWGSWYAILTVTDDAGADCLSPKYQNREIVANYLRLLHAEYINPMNPLETLRMNIPD